MEREFSFAKMEITIGYWLWYRRRGTLHLIVVTVKTLSLSMFVALSYLEINVTWSTLTCLCLLNMLIKIVQLFCHVHPI